MSRTVCPWCKAPFVLKDDVLVCSNTDCPACDEKYLHEELIRTRKALEIAVDALDTVRQYYRGTAVIRPHNIAAYCDNKIDKIKEITALEQKD